MDATKHGRSPRATAAPQMRHAGPTAANAFKMSRFHARLRPGFPSEKIRARPIRGGSSWRIGAGSLPVPPSTRFLLAEVIPHATPSPSRRSGTLLIRGDHRHPHHGAERPTPGSRTAGRRRRWHPRRTAAWRSRVRPKGGRCGAPAGGAGSPRLEPPHAVVHGRDAAARPAGSASGSRAGQAPAMPGGSRR